MRAASAGAHRLASTTQSQVGSGRRSLADARSSARKLESGVAFFGMAWPACCSSDRLEPGHFVDVDEWTGSVRGALLRPPRCFQAQGHSPQRSGRRACCRSANGKWGTSRPCRTAAKCTAPPADCVRATVGVARLDGDARVLTRVRSRDLAQHQLARHGEARRVWLGAWDGHGEDGTRSDGRAIEAFTGAWADSLLQATSGCCSA